MRHARTQAGGFSARDLIDRMALKVEFKGITDRAVYDMLDRMAKQGILVRIVTEGRNFYRLPPELSQAAAAEHSRQLKVDLLVLMRKRCGEIRHPVHRLSTVAFPESLETNPLFADLRTSQETASLVGAWDQAKSRAQSLNQAFTTSIDEVRSAIWPIGQEVIEEVGEPFSPVRRQLVAFMTHLPPHVAALLACSPANPDFTVEAVTALPEGLGRRGQPEWKRVVADQLSHLYSVYLDDSLIDDPALQYTVNVELAGLGAVCDWMNATGADDRGPPRVDDRLMETLMSFTIEVMIRRDKKHPQMVAAVADCKKEFDTAMNDLTRQLTLAYYAPIIHSVCGLLTRTGASDRAQMKPLNRSS